MASAPRTSPTSNPGVGRTTVGDVVATGVTVGVGDVVGVGEAVGVGVGVGSVTVTMIVWLLTITVWLPAVAGVHDTVKEVEEEALTFTMR
jgi:hypothetical protein